MPFIKLTFKPGVNRDQTSYTSEGGWFACDKIRFLSGQPQKIGGWVKYTFETIIGTCRQMWGWVTTFSDNFLALGTNAKVYIEAGGNLYDITPLRETTAAGDVTFAATTGSSIITVSDTSNGAAVGDYVTFVDAVSLGGAITADVLNQNYSIVEVIDGNTYTVDVGVAANSSDVGDGGAACYAEYEIAVGNPGGTYGYGWGTSTWGRGGWGSGSSEPVNLPQTTWFFSNFDNDLVMNQRTNARGPIYYWERGSLTDPSASLATRAVLLSSLAGANEVPVLAGQILVSQNDKHLLAFGAVPYGSANPDDFDPLLIRWANQDDPVEWEPTPTNSAGFIRVSRGSYIVQALATRQEILVFTDSTLESLQFLGTTDVFGLQSLSDNISIMSARAATTVNNVVYWMGIDKFYAYSGRVQTLPTSLRDHVFSNLNYNQTGQIISGTNEGWNEVWWFYPTADSNVVNAYVVYNYLENIWYYGNLSRTAWLDSSLRQYPQAVSGQYIYDHERGVNDDTLPMECYIQSSDFDLGDGEQFMTSRRIIPDVSFNGSDTVENPTPTAYITLVPKAFPGSQPGTEPNLNVIQTSTNIFTDQVYIRARGRTLSFKIGSTEAGVQWQLGSPRLDARPDGKR